MSITGEYPADRTSRLVVAGTIDRLSTYDLRYIKPTPGKSSLDTEPFLTFPTYRNKAHNGEAIGFDICQSLNLIAAATDDSQIR